MADAITMQEFVAALREAPRELSAELRKVFGRAAAVGEREAALNATTRLRVRSDRLRSSIRSKVTGKGSTMSLTLSAGGGRGAKEVKYARIQELGGIVRPKRGQWLSIPSGSNRTAAGVPRVASPRDVPDLYFVRKGDKLLAFSEANGLMFVLVRQVTITAKHYLRDGARAAVEEIEDGVVDAVRSVLVIK